MIKGLEGVFCDERMRTLGVSSLKKKRLRGDITFLCNNMRRESTEGKLDSSPQELMI